MATVHAPEVLGYATPLGTAVGQGVWRDGSKLITTVAAVLPSRCIKCNDPADGFYGARTYYWSSPIYFLLLGVLSLIFRKNAVITLGLCQRHKSRRFKLLLATWLLLPGAFAVMIGVPILGSELRQDWLVVTGLLVGVGILIASLVTGTMARLLVPTKMDKQYAWFKGCGAAFLSELPPAR